MDIFFSDPGDVPVEPKDVKVRVLTVEPYPDGRRVKFFLEISPFTKKPNIEINIDNHEGIRVGSLSIVETMIHKMDFTLHLREKNPYGDYKVTIIVFYNELEKFELGERESVPAEEILKDTRQEVNFFESSFNLPSKNYL